MNCHITGCRLLETKCRNCGRIVSTASFKDEWISVKDRLPKIKPKISHRNLLESEDV